MEAKCLFKQREELDGNANPLLCSLYVPTAFFMPNQLQNSRVAS